MTLDDLGRAIFEATYADEPYWIGVGWERFRDAATITSGEWLFVARVVVLALADDIEGEVWPGQGNKDTPGGRLLALIVEARAADKAERTADH